MQVFRSILRGVSSTNRVAAPLLFAFVYHSRAFALSSAADGWLAKVTARGANATACMVVLLAITRDITLRFCDACYHHY